MAARLIVLKEGMVLTLISQAKAKRRTPEDMLNELPPSDDRRSKPSEEMTRIVAEIYLEYEATLKRNNSLDFDGLLTHGVKLFTQFPSSAEWCEHIFVDEL